MTFAATANAVLYTGAEVRFADVDAGQRCSSSPRRSQPRSPTERSAILPVDYAGQPADYEALQRHRGCVLRAGVRRSSPTRRIRSARRASGRAVGTLADMTVLSLHPAKILTTGEGGAVLTDDDDHAAAPRRFRNHGIATELAARTRLDLRDGRARLQLPADRHRGRARQLAARPGSTQFLARRRGLAARLPRASWRAIRYLDTPDRRAARGPGLALLLRAASPRPARGRPWRRLPGAPGRGDRGQRPLHPRPPSTRTTASGIPGLAFPVAEAAYERLLTLPLHAGMTNADVDDVVAALDKVTAGVRRGLR